MNNQMIQSVNSLPDLKQLNVKSNLNIVLFYDKNLLKNFFFLSWIKKFPNRVALNAGEPLKSLTMYARILSQVSKISIQKNTVFVSLGGGSISDFVGFVASTYKRGQPLIHIPTTWLSAIDSTHGGKTGLNFKGAKNQIGTFYFADKIILSKPVLFSQPTVLIHDAFGEAFKIGIINTPQLLAKPKISRDFLWKNLKIMIHGKNLIVNKDPYEKTGLRQILNLGHTMGHVFEVAHQISHGQSVLLGMLFAARYSFHLGYLKKSEFIKISQILFSVPGAIPYKKVLNISNSKIQKLLFQDKKKYSENELNFIFIQKIGAVFSKKIQISDLIIEVERQRKHL